MYKPPLLISWLVFLSPLSGCADDPVSYSEPITISLKAKAPEIAGAVVSEEKSITTEQGNPYGAFIAAAKQELGGAVPGSIEVDRVQLFLGAGSTQVLSLGQVFAGPTDILFQLNDSGGTSPVASQQIGPTSGAGPLAMEVSFDDETLGAADYERLVGGSFKVVIRGATAAEFAAKDAEANLEVTFSLTAYE